MLLKTGVENTGQKIEQVFGSQYIGRQKQCYNRILKLQNGNADVLADYLVSYKRDNPGIANSTLSITLLNLIRFAERVNKPFTNISYEDVLKYLDGFRKSESLDPNGRWRGMYNLFVIIITRFFKWLYYSDIDADERPKPVVVGGLRKAKPKGGKKRKRYGPGDMWGLDDNEVFLKYCPDPRIKGYHALAIDTGARPHELLGLKIEDIIWPPDGQPPRFILNGKTGPRVNRSMRYHKYLRNFIDQHPKRSIPSSILFYSKKTGGILNEDALRLIYVDKLKPYFTKLLDNPIGQDDRNQILHLLKKPWNPNVFRHSTATEFAGILSDADAKQWFGWTDNSDMPSNYRNYYGDEASKHLMISFGLEPQSQKVLPKMRECPNVICKELNTPDTPFCVKCRVPLTVAGHIEQSHQKGQDMQALRNEMAQSKQEIKDRFQAYESKMAEFVHDIQASLNHEETQHKISTLVMKKMTEILDRVAPDWFQEVYGPNAQRLTPKAHEKINGWLKVLTSQIDAENRERDLELQKQKKVLIDSIGTNV
jgi:integrase